MCRLLIVLLVMPLQLVSAQEYNPFVAWLLDQTRIDSLVTNVQILSGEKPFIVDDSMMVIGDRGTYGTEIDKARTFLTNQLSRFGLTVYKQEFSIGSVSAWNILAEQKGWNPNGKLFVVCAHYDSVGNPGADDNGSGTAAVLEIARILSRHSFEHTILYALWDAEERGLVGSRFYANSLDTTVTRISGVLNLDMLGWDSDDDGKFDIHTRDIGGSVALAQVAANIDSVYSLPLTPVIYNPGTHRSDHAAFWSIGVGAIIVSQAYWGGDFSRFYHGSRDYVEHFNLPFYLNLTKLSLGTLASLLTEANSNSNPAGHRPSSPRSDLLNSFPNPVTDYTVLDYFLSREGMVSIRVWDTAGRLVRSLPPRHHEKGRHIQHLDADDLSSGTYLITITHSTGTASGKISVIR